MLGLPPDRSIIQWGYLALISVVFLFTHLVRVGGGL